VAAQVRHDHAMPGEVLDHRCEHLAGDHQPVHKQQGRPGTAFGE
jgi:hypothetical protein